MNEVSDEALDAAAIAFWSHEPEDADWRDSNRESMRAALAAALPHLITAERERIARAFEAERDTSPRLSDGARARLTWCASIARAEQRLPA